ncbi:hypothetical protein AB0F91_41795 [Amycolatopsis sp. NPDC023774]|uniref:hypothetical protein n=1 Tax=Amycolatopsis sp. NPDC023774 TaxID=3155015 RepID=UPI0033F32B89
MRAVALAVVGAMADLPCTASGRIHDDPEDPMPCWERTTSLWEFPAEAADAFIGALGPESRSPLANVETGHLASPSS